MIDYAIYTPRHERGYLCSFDSGSNDSTQIAKTDSAPWAAQQPYLQDIFGRAQQTYFGGQPNYYPNATYVPASQQTEQGLNQIQSLAQQGGSLTPAATNTALRTINGDFLTRQNPEFQGMVQNAFNAARPAIDSAYASAGRGISGARDAALADSWSNAVTNLAGQNYANERQLQQQMVGQAPTLDQARFNDAQALMGVGSTREGYANQALQDQINRWDFQQNQPWNNLSKYAALVGGGQYGGQTTQTIPTQSNPWLTGLGTASTLASIAGSLFGRSGVFR